MFRVVILQAQAQAQAHGDLPRWLVALPPGIGDVVSVGLSAIDQIIKNEAAAHGKIDVLCNAQQAELLRYDPRINSLIVVDGSLFPAAGSGTFLRGVFLSDELTPLFHFLQKRHYTAVLPGLPAPTFYSRLHTPLMHPRLVDLGKDLLALQSCDQAKHISTITRQAVNAYFESEKSILEPPEEVTLFLPPDAILSAQLLASDIKRRLGDDEERNCLLLVAPDTSSDVTRPPLPLLRDGIAGALSQVPEMIVSILPSYTKVQTSTMLFEALSSQFPGRVEALSREPVSTLLATTALIDQADIFLSGDTGVMHLAVATKHLAGSAEVAPKNAVKIITLFGGTNPGLYGYPARAMILGRDRKEQKLFSPGVAKEFYISTGKNLFDHITAQQVTDALLQTISVIQIQTHLDSSSSGRC